MDMNNELQHHGTKGMKWGVRRYQNKDGSLTALGKKRLGQTSVGSSKKKAKKEKVKTETPKKKSVSEMSDDELKKAINRARDEDTYNSLRPEKTPAGKRFFRALGRNVIAPAATAAGKRFLENALNKAADSLLKDVADPDSIDALKKEFEKLDYKVKIDKLKNPDKYLSWEDRLKKQQHEKNERERAEKEAKNNENNSGGNADSNKSNKKDNSSDNTSESTTNSNSNNTDANQSTNTSSGRSFVSNLPALSEPFSRNDTSTRRSASDGESYVAEILDEDGNVLRRWRE